MAEETMKDFEKEIEESFKSMNVRQTIDEEDMTKWDNLKEMMEDKTKIKVKITEVVKGGCIAFVNEVRGFIPASHLSADYVEKIDDYQGKHIEVEIINVEPEKKRLVLSHKVIDQEERAARAKERLEAINVGDILTGKVETIKDYGAFISLGESVSGLLHISQISYTHIKHPGAVLKEGQEVTVKVLDIKDGKISLSMKALLTPPGEFGETSFEDESDGFKYEEDGVASTSLGSLLKGIKLD